MKTTLILIILLFFSHAHAYLDGGSGSVFIQLILGGLVGAGAFIKFYWHKISVLFKSFFKKNNK